MAKKQNFRITLPIAKIDEAQRLVYGIAAIEQVDKTKEILDYDSSKPYFESWSADIAKATQGRSLGNVREMHENSAVGKLTEFVPNDELKQFEVCAKVVDDAAWEKVSEGVYTGFSIGGEYERRWDDPNLKNVKRYTAKPAEISLVDNPCIPGATFEYVKSDGASELRKFAPKMSDSDVDRVASAVANKLAKAEKKTKAVDGVEHPASDFAFVGDPQDTDTWHLPIFDEAHVHAALSRFNQTEGLGNDKAKVARRLIAAAKKYGIDATNFTDEYVKSVVPNLKKGGLWHLSNIAEVVMNLEDIRYSIISDLASRGEPMIQEDENILTQINTLTESLIAMCSEELNEMVEETQSAAKTVSTEHEMLKKEIDAVMTKFETSTDPDMQKVASHLKTIGKCVDKLCDDHQKMGKSLDVLDGKEDKAEKSATHLKEIGEHVEKIRKCHESMGKSLDTLKGGDDADAKDGDKANDKKEPADDKNEDDKAEKVTTVELSKAVEDRFVKYEENQNQITEALNTIATTLAGFLKSDAPVNKAFTKVATNGSGVVVTKNQDTGGQVEKGTTPVATVGNGSAPDQRALVESLKKKYEGGGSRLGQ
jgi:hypothetical protein